MGKRNGSRRVSGHDAGGPAVRLRHAAMTRWRRPGVIIVGLLSACASPGSTIDVISQNEATVALEYTHSYSFELGETIKRAERACVPYGKHAVMISNTK